MREVVSFGRFWTENPQICPREFVHSAARDAENLPLFQFKLHHDLKSTVSIEGIFIGKIDDGIVETVFVIDVNTRHAGERIAITQGNKIVVFSQFFRGLQIARLFFCVPEIGIEIRGRMVHTQGERQFVFRI